MCTICMLGALKGHKKLVEPLEQELRMVVSDHVSTENETQILCRSNKYS